MMELVITALAIVYVIFSVTMQRKLTNPSRTQEIQKLIKDKSKELNDLAKGGASQEQMAKKQKEVTTLLSESMRSQMKPMFVILPIFFIMFYVVFPAVFPADLKVDFLSAPWDYKSYFIMVSFVVGIATSLGMSVYDKMRLAKKQKQAAEGDQTPPA
jgi:uncharacterized membrane protein (DUF106 family)